VGRLAPHYCPEGCGYANQVFQQVLLGVSCDITVQSLPFPSAQTNLALLHSYFCCHSRLHPYSTSGQPQAFFESRLVPKGTNFEPLRKRIWGVLRGSDIKWRGKAVPAKFTQFSLHHRFSPTVAPPRGPVPDLALTAASNTKSLSPPSFVTLHTFPLILICALYKPG
jgi:hypothetical protein